VTAGTPSLKIGPYRVDPATIAEATKIIVDEDLADHVDMNFGCPKSTH
jgi:tRNA-dihydrouridine synthase